MNAKSYFLGLMSGTSMDGIDAGLFNIADNSIESVSTLTYPWPDDLKAALGKVDGGTPLATIGQLDSQVGELFGLAANILIQQSGISASQIRAIGSHGQTVLHCPQQQPAFTIQIGDPNIIAERTGITTVADFRRRDMAAGGQGAPLVPGFHEYLLGTNDENRTVVNIGGIANITLLCARDRPMPVRGFDTGPGNGVMDRWIGRHLGLSYDANGDWASAGTVIDALLTQLLTDTYFSRPAPKSTGPEYFNLAWLERHLQATNPSAAKPEDVQATLAALTAATIANAIKQEQPGCQRVIVCGGGIHNAALLKNLRNELTDVPVCSTQDFGLNPDYVEAAAFAWFAQRTLDGLSSNLPSVTGASHAVILGGIYPANPRA